MKKIELVKGIYSSSLGFGCAPILGSVDRKSAQYAIEFAIDNGINHLDLARSYGYGEAEDFVGKVLGHKKNELVIASKFGIKANQLAVLFKKFKPIIRTILKNGDGNSVRIKTSNNENNFSKYLLKHISPLNGIDMRKNLENSLKAIDRDYLDIYFVHEPLETLINFEELLETANILKKEGKIKAFGLAYRISQQHLHESYISKFDILQFNNPSSKFEYDSLVLNRGTKCNVIYSTFRGGPKILNPADKLRKQMDDFPNSVFLVSMFNLEHIKQNIDIANK